MSEHYDQVVRDLVAQNEFAIKYDLDAMNDVVSRLNMARTARVSVIVAGTNGKGAVCALLNGIAIAAGWRVGLFTSPHLVEPRERVRIDGQPISQNAFAEIGAEMLRRFGGRSGPPESQRALSYFELTTLIGARAFADAAPPLDLAIWEVGLGGRLDATNALDHDIAILTSVALDHQQYLGTTEAAIAAEKAAVSRPGRPVIAHPKADGAALIRGAVAATGARVVLAPDVGGGTEEMNRSIAATAATEVARRLGADLPSAVVAAGCAGACWPGRRTELDGRGVHWFVDGGHNPAATQRVAAWLDRALAPGERLPAIVASSPGRDLRAVFAPLAARVSHATCVPASSFRTVPPDEVAAAWRSLGVPATTAAVPTDVFARSQAPRILVLGSLYLAGALYEWLGYDADALTVWRPDVTP